jgi:hypothetical protein
MRLLHFVAVRTFPSRRLGQKIMGAPRAGPSLRMPSFWVRHTYILISCPYGPAHFGRIVSGFRPGKLLFFQPVLLEARERS